MKISIKSKEDFEALMDEVDSILQAKGVPIHARQIQAIGEVAKKFNIDLLVGPLCRGAIPNVYEGESLSAHILQWFDQRYGDRLKIDFSIGYSTVMLRGDAWLLKFPLIYGTVTILCDRDLHKKYNNFVMNEAGKPQQKAMMNLLLLIEKFPQGLANRLTDDELREILNYFSSVNKFFNRIHSSYSGNELASGVVTDLETSARFAVGTSHDYGQSLWASLQAAEKILKFFIVSKGEKFPKTHDISKLAKQAYGLGLPLIDADLLKLIQCKADVRYEQRKYSVKKVVDAHQGAMQIASLVTESVFTGIKAKAGSGASMSEQSPVVDEPMSFNTIFKPGHFYRSPMLGYSYYCRDIVDDLATIILVESYQYGHLFQAVCKLKVECQGFYVEVIDEAEIDRLKQVGEKIIRAQGVT